MQRPDHSASDGFILIEILVALSIVAIMGAMMAGVLGQLRSVSQMKERILAQAELSAAASHLQRTLAGARKAPLAENDPETNYLLDGSASEIRFATVTRQGFYSLALRDVRISVERDAGETQLVQRLAPRRPEGSGDELPEMLVIILDNVDRVVFEYSEDGASYSPRWKKDDALPLTIRVSVSRDVAGKAVSATAIARLL